MARSPQFGVFVPQGWRMDLVDLAEPTIDAIWFYDHFHATPEPKLETTIAYRSGFSSA